LEVVHSK